MLFRNIEDACGAVTLLKQHDVSAVELMDRSSFRSIEGNKGMPDFLHELGNDVAALLDLKLAQKTSHISNPTTRQLHRRCTHSTSSARRACIDVCPTQAIVGERLLDARRCISYLTIEHDGPIPVPLRAAMGDRIYGCDDCQLVCPWNKYAVRATLPDFDSRDAFDAPTLLALWGWDEPTFLRATEGSAIRLIGHARWQRNLAVALGNAWPATGDEAYSRALQAGRDSASAMLREHIDWALATR